MKSWKKARTERWTCAFWPHCAQNGPVSGVPQLRQFVSCVWPFEPRRRSARRRGPAVRRSPHRRSLRIPRPSVPLARDIMRCVAAHASRSPAMARIGLLGGSFNPAHRGHRHISLEAMRALGLDEVWWLVSPGNPAEGGREGHGAVRGAARFGSAHGARRANPRQRLRAARAHALHRRYGAAAQAPPPRASLHLVARKRHPAKFSLLA